jgi:hypothetical protein
MFEGAGVSGNVGRALRARADGCTLTTQGLVSWTTGDTREIVGAAELNRDWRVVPAVRIRACGGHRADRRQGLVQLDRQRVERFDIPGVVDSMVAERGHSIADKPNCDAAERSERTTGIAVVIGDDFDPTSAAIVGRGEGDRHIAVEPAVGTIRASRAGDGAARRRDGIRHVVTDDHLAIPFAHAILKAHVGGRRSGVAAAAAAATIPLPTFISNFPTGTSATTTTTTIFIEDTKICACATLSKAATQPDIAVWKGGVRRGRFLLAPGKPAVAGVTSTIPFASGGRATVARIIRHRPILR